MEFHANEGKSVNIEVNGKTYARHAIHTHFVQVGESYIDLVEKYVKPLWQPGDLLSSSEKIIGLCQKRVVYKKDMKVGRLARFLSRFASHSSAGIGVDSQRPERGDSGQGLLHHPGRGDPEGPDPGQPGGPVPGAHPLHPDPPGGLSSQPAKRPLFSGRFVRLAGFPPKFSLYSVVLSSIMEFAPRRRAPNEKKKGCFPWN